MKQITNLVYQILLNDRNARNSDKYLYLRVVERTCPEALTMQFANAFLMKKMPSTETVRRARQKLQAMHPELCADSDVEAMRMINEEKVREWAIHG